ncbi:MAG: hypothetical protein GC129_03170 [Proteobacteria bacterium]|nr:hypothetical protein [Pseudomonadota bacterium]
MSTHAPLLEILQNPNHPAFARAVGQLASILPQSLPPEELPSLLAELEATIAILTKAKNATGEELAQLRAKSQALKSYRRQY